jgi:leucyl aminopeptidase
MELRGMRGAFANAEVHALAVALFKDEKLESKELQELDKLTGGVIRSLLETGEFKGKEDETVYVHLPENPRLSAKRLLLIGAGSPEEYGLPQVFKVGGTAIRTLIQRKITSIALVPRYTGSNIEEASSAAIEGAITGLFEPSKYRTVDKDDKKLEKLILVLDGDEQAINRGIDRGRIVGESVNFTRDLSNEPGVFMTPSILAERAAEISKQFGMEIDVLDQSRMEKEGMGALLGVARGSDEPPKLIVLEYNPPANSSKDHVLALVGKGLTFDSGGISIKPGEGMEQMKYDMTGGATVLGVMRAIAQLKPPMKILGIVPSAENMPSGKAVKPGDVLRAMSGKTIEVINTDAEGRLILADAIAYAKKLGATQVIDMATLTGAVSIALGDVNTAVMGTDQVLINRIIDSGKEVGEKFWQLPLDKEYSRQIKSEIADIKNVGGRKGGAITAAAFLKEFADGISWAHLDIAGTAWGDEAKPFRAKGPTGIAVRTLVNFVDRESGSRSR